MSGACKYAPDTDGIKIWDVRVGSGYFIENRDETRTVKFPHPKGECCVCRDEGGLKMHCEHFICPDDLLIIAWDSIGKRKHEISCGSCTSIISVDDIIKFGMPKMDEEQFLISAISVNFCESQDIQQCPRCKSYCERMDSTSPQVKCTVCSKKLGREFQFCWYCLNIWKDISNIQNCGNPKCKQDVVNQLHDSPKMIFEDNQGISVSVPQIRACPRCSTIIHHDDGCNEMTCICGLMFCFICLRNTSEGSLLCTGRDYTDITCTPAPVQTLRSD